MAKLDSTRRKDLLEGRDSCKALLTSIEQELAGDFEDSAKAAGGDGAIAFKVNSPEIRNAITEARTRPLASPIARG